VFFQFVFIFQSENLTNDKTQEALTTAVTESVVSGRLSKVKGNWMTELFDMADDEAKMPLKLSILISTKRNYTL